MTIGDEEIMQSVRIQLKSVAPAVDPAAITAQAHIADSGVDSIQVLELITNLEDSLNIELPDEGLGSVRTYGDLVAAVSRALQAATS